MLVSFLHLHCYYYEKTKKSGGMSIVETNKVYVPYAELKSLTGQIWNVSMFLTFSVLDFEKIFITCTL